MPLCLLASWEQVVSQAMCSRFPLAQGVSHSCPFPAHLFSLRPLNMTPTPGPNFGQDSGTSTFKQRFPYATVPPALWVQLVLNCHPLLLAPSSPQLCKPSLSFIFRNTNSSPSGDAFLLSVQLGCGHLGKLDASSFTFLLWFYFSCL